MIIMGVAITLMIFAIIRPLKSASSQLNNIIEDIEDNNGNLTARINVMSDDEIGILVDGINIFIEKLQLIMKDINVQSEVLRTMLMRYQRQCSRWRLLCRKCLQQ